MLAIKNLYSGYEGTDVIKDVTMNIGKGELFCIVGPNGCGKSTLLKSIARLLDYRGSITLDGQEVSSFTRKDLAKKIALLGQLSPVYFPYTVYDTVSLGRYAYSSGFLKNLSKADEAFLLDIIHKLGLYEVRDRMIHELSGGQLQRVFLARTLAQNPDIILLDEPTNHLDLKHQIELLHYLITWVKETHKTVVGVLHDLTMVHCFGDTAALMHYGKILSIGKPHQVLDGATLKAMYDMDIRQFMLESLERWKTSPDHTG
ncbi:MAG: ABC transporter ATP-binding protein [Treponema sp.]|jgi:iron complex transport system ATP-binding protein|nr:ABC transporter ATP-binding protein [Treponema sp.]